MNLDWLKDSTNTFSYARICGFIAIVVNLIWLLYTGVDSINNIWQAIVKTSGLITGIALWLIELFREIKNISVKLGGKNYEYKKE